MEALVDFFATCQVLKNRVVQALVKNNAKYQALRLACQSQFVEALVGALATCQALKSTWQNRVVQALEENKANI